MKNKEFPTEEEIEAAAEELYTHSKIDSKGIEHNTEKDSTIIGNFEPVDDSTSNIDWEQRRYEIAKAAMQGLLSNSELNSWTEMDCAKYAVACAEVLIKELKEK